MNPFLTTLIFVTLLLLSKARLGKPQTDEESAANLDSNGFNFYVFASEWAGSICSINDCNLNSADGFWNIHGLWPTDHSRQIQDCTKDPFNFDSLERIKERLNQYWSGLYDSSELFLRHEWSKHGTCSRMGQEEYFSTGLQVAAHLEVYETLKLGGIVPGKAYDCQEIAKVVTHKYGVRAFSIESKGGYLIQILICLDLGLKPRDCPHSNICTGSVKYPHYIH